MVDRKQSVVVPAIVKITHQRTSSEDSENLENNEEEEEGEDKKEEGSMEDSNMNEQGEQDLEKSETSKDMEPVEKDDTCKDNPTEDDELVQYQFKWTKLEQSWSVLNGKMDEFVAGKDPWEKMADLYSELNEMMEDIEDRFEVNAKRGEEIYRLGTNPGPLTEAYKVCVDTITSVVVHVVL